MTEWYIRLGVTLVIVIALVWILIRFRAKSNPQKSSLDILRERRDKGEITQKEFEEARKNQQGE
ncbi:SHOCT domain-containing protein [Virgibacillus sp. C22-A2]|uniref:SHOCT domain-containing protein n=1 Tax=Virgibacillus tibetensis TaxID=3042313 RepID=A0ABU6KGY8_9BACI|nr:SHOCT domain-containing protein [Virgibacillus sp. C22-A2]